MDFAYFAITWCRPATPGLRSVSWSSEQQQ